MYKRDVFDYIFLSTIKKSLNLKFLKDTHQHCSFQDVFLNTKRLPHVTCYILAGDLEILAVAKIKEEIQSDLNAISNWAETNGMSTVPDNCYKLEFRGLNTEYNVGSIRFEDQEEVKDKGIIVKKIQLVYPRRHEVRKA